MLIVISEQIYENSPYRQVGAMQTALTNINIIASDALSSFDNKPFVQNALKTIIETTNRHIAKKQGI